MRAPVSRLPIATSLTRCFRNPLLAFACTVGLMAATGSAHAAESARNIGLVLSTWHFYVNPASDVKQDCPDGLQVTDHAEFNAQYPTQEDRDRQFKLGMHYLNRGPNGENVTYSPWAVKDPIPARYLQSHTGYGMNLDGTDDGHETAKTCSHEKFTSPNGERGIDNQMYRVLGCIRGYRTGGFQDLGMTQDLRNYPANRILIEVSGVDDEKNDAHVEVTFLRGRNGLPEDNAKNVIPWHTQVVDDRAPEVVQHTTGRIVNGVLETDPVELRLPMIELHSPLYVTLFNMRMRLNLSDTGAKGMITGYQDIDGFYQYFARSTGVVDHLAEFNTAAVYNGLHRFADGDKDPKAGQCRAISTVYYLEATRVFIVHSRARAKQTAQARIGALNPAVGISQGQSR
jgi:hypothetical protein